MEDKELTTLHPYLNRNKNRYPNVKDENIPESIQRKLIPGDGISIDGNNVISATTKEVDVYTKDESDAKYATKTECDDLSKVTPTDIGIKDNKLGLLHDSLWLTNQSAINLENFEYDEATNTLKPKGGGENSVSPTLWLIDTNNLSIRTTITEVEKTNIDKGLYNQVMFFASATYDSVSDIEIYAPSKFNSSSFGNLFTIFTAKEKEDGFIINGLNLYTLDINDKDSNNEYPIKITKVTEMPIENVGKSISLFGNHSILVPSDSSDNNIDLYNHNIVITSADKKSVIYMTITSSSNLIVDSITDLNTLLKTQSRNIMVTGIRTLDGGSLPIISIDWNGAFVGSNYTWVDPVNEEDNESLTTAFGSGTITDVVTTI